MIPSSLRARAMIALPVPRRASGLASSRSENSGNPAVVEAIT
jgi:hypothetical protein